MTSNDNPFKTRIPSVCDNKNLRTPQKEAFACLREFALNPEHRDREVGIVLPVGCGKSGCITLAPFAFKSSRVLVVAPSVKIAQQLCDDFDPTKTNMFYKKCQVLRGQPFPEHTEIRGKTTNKDDLNESHVVITNIQQLQGTENRWLQNLSSDFFDLILFDEGHHSIAESWETLKLKFPAATIVNFSATPLRADGNSMAGMILYTYSIFRAIQEGYVKRLKAIVLNPESLCYVRREDEQEVEVPLDEVRRLGEEDADFRRSIVTSTETLNTIADASINELERLRESSQDSRIKIIASALNYHHCHQVVEAYRARGFRADFVHSRVESNANERAMQRLENHDLDVIVQVRKLNEGFDHPYLSVAAVFSVFSNLSPFVQFVGRIMRVIKQNAPGDVLNQGSVVFHAGANIAKRWEDFQDYSLADQGYFDQLLPMESLEFASGDEIRIEPNSSNTNDFANFEVAEEVDIINQSSIWLEEIPLFKEDPDAFQALLLLKEKGYSETQLIENFEKLDQMQVPRYRQRQAKRLRLDEEVKRLSSQVLETNGLNPYGHELDRKRLQKTNFETIKSSIDRQINDFAGKNVNERDEFTLSELEGIFQELPQFADRVNQEFFSAET